MASGTIIGDAYINIMPSTKDFGANLSASMGGLSSVAKGAGSAIGVAIQAGIQGTVALTKSVGELAQSADLIDKNSQKLGVSAQFYQEWEAVLQHSGSSMDAMGTSFKKLATISQDATDEQIAAFEKLGMSMEEVSQMSAEDLFANVVSNLQGMEEGNERAALATQLLGKNAQELGPLFNTTAEETQEMIDKVHELGGVLSDEAVANGAAFQDNLQDMKTAISGLTNSLLQELLPGFTEVMGGLASFISGDEGGLQSVADGITGIFDSIMTALPSFLEIAGSIVIGLADSIIASLPQLAQTGLSILSSLGEYIIQNLPQLINTALTLIVQFASFLTQSLPSLLPAVVEIILTIVENLLDNIDMVVECAIELIMALAVGLVDALPVLMEKAPTIIEKLVEAIIKNAPKLIMGATEILMELAGGLIQYAHLVWDKIPDIINGIIEGLKAGIDGIVGVGGDFIRGLWEGISDKSDWIIEQIKSFGEDVLQGIKDFFGIKSPSRVMRDQVGKMLPEGMAIGIEANASSVLSAMDDISNMTLDSALKIPSDIAQQRYSFNTTSENRQLMELLQKYLPVIAENNDVNVEINTDPEGMFRAMQKQNSIYKKRVGISAFT